MNGKFKGTAFNKNVLTFTFDQLNASLLNKTISSLHILNDQ